MSRIILKNMPKLKLSDLLRRRKMTLKQLLNEFGITTYEGLVIRCARMGVLHPVEAEFRAALPGDPVNNPSEGVVVLEPPPVIDDITGRRIDPEAPVTPEVRVITDQLLNASPDCVTTGQPSLEPPEPTQKKQRKKKDPSQGE